MINMPKEMKKVIDRIEPKGVDSVEEMVVATCVLRILSEHYEELLSLVRSSLNLINGEKNDHIN